jgi:hypothetical protein
VYKRGKDGDGIIVGVYVDDCWSIAIKQSAYAKKVFIRFGMMDCNTIKTPMDPRDHDGHSIDTIEYRHVIGYFPYLLHTRPDLPFVVTPLVSL